MAKAKVLLQLDADSQPSVFDSMVAVDAGVDHLLRHGDITPDKVTGLVHGTIFTRGPDSLHNTAIFIGGSDVAAGESLLEAVTSAFFGPLRVSVMMDANGANTTAAAAVWTAAEHLSLADHHFAVLGSTGPVGQRVVRLLAGEGARVRVISRSRSRADGVCERVAATGASGTLEAAEISQSDDAAEVLSDVDAVIAAGAAGVQLLTDDARRRLSKLKLAIDLNAVPPVGLEGIEPGDRGVERDGQIHYGAIGVGGLKMQIHKAAIKKLFESNDAVLNAEQIFALAATL